MSDLVSGVLTRISELEALARDAKIARGNGAWVVVAGSERRWDVPELDTEIHSGGQSIARLSAEYGGYFHALHVVEHDPESILRLCRAHRQIVELWQEANKEPNPPEALILADAMLRALAVGLGVVEEDR